MTADMGLAPLKPKLRGWLHAAMLPLSLAAGIVLVIFAPTQPGKIGGAVFLAASVLLFGTSAIYHRFSWGTKGSAILRRMDHANIFIFIAATYTPMALLLLDGADRWWLLGLVWGAAILGLLSRIFWLSAPRWFYTLLYLAVGWAAVGWLKPFWDNGGPLVVGLIIAGGLLYSSAHSSMHARPRTRHHSGSASTRSSTCAPCWPSPATTPRSASPPTPPEPLPEAYPPVSR